PPHIFSTTPPPPRSTPFPYTTLFRSELSTTRTPAHTRNAEQLRLKIAVESSRGRATVVFHRLHLRLWSAQFSFNITGSALDPTGTHMKSSGMARLPTKAWTKERVSRSL